MKIDYIQEEKALINKVMKYLKGLGYSSESLVFDYKIGGNYVDIAIFDSTKLVGIVEVKRKDALSLQNKEELPFNRTVRRTQSLSDINNCNFFVISNGDEHVWMQTSSTGRAIQISEIPAQKNLKTSVRDEKYVHSILWRCVDYLRGNSLNHDYFLDFSIVLSELLRINSGDKYETQLSRDTREIISNNYSRFSEQQLKVISNSVGMLADLNESLAKYASSILSFIDELLIKRNRDIFVPHWLSDLMIELSVSNKKSKVVNLFARDGSILGTAHARNLSEIRLYSSEEHLLIWSRLRARLLGLSDTNIFFAPGLQLGKFPQESNADSVIMAPPFNVHIENSNYSRWGNKKKLDSTFCYIVESLRIIAPDGLLAIVVPDSFLYNQASKNFRKELEHYGTVEAVISLPKETFSSYANVASSILVIRNSISSQKNHQVFFGIIPSNVNHEQKHHIIRVLKDNYSIFQRRGDFRESPETFSVKQLDASNWHHSKYHYLKFSELESNVSKQFNLVPLKELIVGAHKGTSFVKTDDGDIPYVNPANVREMSLDSENLLYTSEDKVKSKFRPLELDDIVVNAISNYRGCAAIVDDPDFVGLGANRHIIIIRPDDTVINPFYLAVIINSEHVRKQLFDLTTGAVIPSITLKAIENLQIPVPSVNVQNEIASSYRAKKLELNRVLSKAREIEVEIKDFVSNLGK